jgi:alkanesulfonate monooxygenase SsuD/methylene tetrahydromethanopterin reductase-like flavin-dependent oxidoreductase (luciferase family)
MKIGLHALGIGTGAQPGVIAAASRAAEAAGFVTLWAGEHVVMVDEPRSRYPYSGDGRIAVPADADWLDPLLALTFAAAVTSRIALATGILLLPEHNPVLAAKQIATARPSTSRRCAPCGRRTSRPSTASSPGSAVSVSTPSRYVTGASRS